VKKLSLIPADVWIALTIAAGLFSTAVESTVFIFVGVHGMVCAYVVVQTFTKD